MNRVTTLAGILPGILIGAGALAAATSDDLTPTQFMVRAEPAVPGAIEGKVTGRIVLEGEKPEVKPLDIPAEKAKGCVKEGEAMDTKNESLLIGKDNGIANAVVKIEVPDAKVTVPDKPIDLDQMACHYKPHVMVIPAGSTVEYRNSDPAVSHNVHTYPRKNDALNKTIAGGSKETQKLDQVDTIELKCDIHPWMNAWLIVEDTPYVAVTDADGNFSIPGLKAGDYKVKVWHEKLGKADGKVTVKEDGSADKLEIKMGEGKKGPPKRK
jgi:plastocyanin